MPFVPVPNAALAEIRMTVDSQQVENTLWFAGTTEPDAPSLVTLANNVAGWWIDNYAPLVGAEVILREVYVSSQHSADGPTSTFVPPVTTTGAISEEVMPNNVALTVSFRTAFRGRSRRGRNYVVGLVQSQVVVNTITAAVAASWIDAYEAVGTAVSGTGFTWVVASRFSGVDADGRPIPRAEGIVTPVSAVVIVDRIVDSQRRRLPGRGQ
jgi:hypothetical protein